MTIEISRSHLARKGMHTLRLLRATALSCAVALACGPVVNVKSEPRQPISIIPRPTSVEAKAGSFQFGRDTVLVASGAAAEPAQVFAEQLAPVFGATLTVQPSGYRGSIIEMAIDPALARLGDEGYRLSVDSRRVVIRAAAPAGLFYGTQTLRQLMPDQAFGTEPTKDCHWLLPAVEVEDHPRFAWRGALLDPARNFITVEQLEHFIDLLAMHKLNTLQLHLTDDQGWRIEIKKYPALTAVASHRTETVIGHPWDRDPPIFDHKPHGGFYTQDQIRHLVTFARRRNVTLVPEIEMPGHTQAAVASYPFLGSIPQKQDVSTNFGVHDNILLPTDESIAFMQDVLTEVMELFPSQYIHIGGDEAKKGQWKTNAFAEARIKQLGLENEEELQAWFVAQMDKFLTEHGRRLVGWDEILEGGVSPNATVMSWRGEEGGITAATAGHDVVMSPGLPTYLDSCQTLNKADCDREPLNQDTYVTIDHLLAYDPVPAALAPDKRKHVLGTQASIWGEFTYTYKQVSYQAWPRLAVFAEVAWCSQESRNREDVLTRLHTHLARLDARLDAMGVERFREAGPQLRARRAVATRNAP